MEGGTMETTTATETKQAKHYIETYKGARLIDINETGYIERADAEREIIRLYKEQNEDNGKSAEQHAERLQDHLLDLDSSDDMIPRLRPVQYNYRFEIGYYFLTERGFEDVT